MQRGEYCRGEGGRGLSECALAHWPIVQSLFEEQLAEFYELACVEQWGESKNGKVHIGIGIGGCVLLRTYTQRYAERCTQTHTHKHIQTLTPQTHACARARSFSLRTELPAGVACSCCSCSQSLKSAKTAKRIEGGAVCSSGKDKGRQVSLESRSEYMCWAPMPHKEAIPRDSELSLRSLHRVWTMMQGGCCVRSSRNAGESVGRGEGKRECVRRSYDDDVLQPCY
jgi:hypothetical protein